MSKQLKKSGSGVSGGEIVSPPFLKRIATEDTENTEEEEKRRREEREWYQWEIPLRGMV